MYTVPLAVDVTFWSLAVICTVPLETPLSWALPLPVQVAIETGTQDQDTPLVK
jgi:hypothetical protein